MVQDAPQECFIYLDPPYYEKGAQLYKHNMSPEDHEDLATRLQACKAQWLLSYDDHPRIRELYDWAQIEPVFVKYSNAVCKTDKRPKNQEIVIRPKQS
jgi:DNA adenine methylase